MSKRPGLRKFSPPVVCLGEVLGDANSDAANSWAAFSASDPEEVISSPTDSSCDILVTMENGFDAACCGA